MTPNKNLFMSLTLLSALVLSLGACRYHDGYERGVGAGGTSTWDRDPWDRGSNWDPWERNHDRHDSYDRGRNEHENIERERARDEGRTGPTGEGRSGGDGGRPGRLAGLLSKDFIAANAWAEKFDFSTASAMKFHAALVSAENGDAAKLTQLGLDRNDLKDLAQQNMLKSSTLNQLAQNLNQPVASTRKMIAFIQADVKAQAKDVESPLWQKCMSSGKWVTPENSSCSESYWSGCSPKTGASFCLAQ